METIEQTRFQPGEGVEVQVNGGFVPAFVRQYNDEQPDLVQVVLDVYHLSVDERCLAVAPSRLRPRNSNTDKE